MMNSLKCLINLKYKFIHTGGCISKLPLCYTSSSPSISKTLKWSNHISSAIKNNCIYVLFIVKWLTGEHIKTISNWNQYFDDHMHTFDYYLTNQSNQHFIPFTSVLKIIKWPNYRFTTIYNCFINIIFIVKW